MSKFSYHSGSSGEEDYNDSYSSAEDENFADQDDHGSQSDEAYGNNRTYFWYVELTLNKIIIRDRIYNSKQEAIKVATNVLKSFDSSDANKLAHKVGVLPTGSRHNDDISLSQGKYSVEIRRVVLYM